MLYETIGRGVNTVVHCRAGIGRTGMVAVGVLLHAGLEPEAALEHVAKARGIAVPDTSEQRDWLFAHGYDILQHGTGTSAGDTPSIDSSDIEPP